MSKFISGMTWIGGAVRLLLEELRLARRRRGAVKDLKRLTRWELADIGIARHQIRDVVELMLSAPGHSVAPGTLAEMASEQRDPPGPVKHWQKAA